MFCRSFVREPRRFGARARLVASVALWTGVAGALAQPEAAPSLPTVVITASRSEQSLPDALPSTRVITRRDIEQSPAPDLPSLLRTLTSADVAQTGPLGSQTSVFLRGADSRQTLVLIDGTPFSRADFGTASWQHLPLDQIERIEIVRGNLSSLYGAQAVGGVVQIVTRRASAP
jgi:vitamin B12 transporter